jgi:hypothetical protein
VEHAAAPQERNTSAVLATYPEFREKMDRRIERFFEKTQTARRTEDIWNGQDGLWRYMLENVRLHV